MITLVLGGARSGKSALAERLTAVGPGPTTYVATMQAGDDPDLRRRIEIHRDRRPAGWTTLEAGLDLPDLVMAAPPGSLLIDSLGPWVALHGGAPVDEAALCRALRERAGDHHTVVVSEEVGLGVHPSSAEGRQFRDALGHLNQAVAAVADRALLVVAGRTLTLDPPPAVD
ncbi:MAG TPA: bifunctional adenosylcobinamide kinase/adenosylcobinamide-phosphate guanylyltransferase [Acidimicrobiales bacterium]|nr:bifunctional adenosylcobinamide kinase/adenosylcobinamide-phosphate guanylyltransferase [Acidimicrobiales bacterium]